MRDLGFNNTRCSLPKSARQLITSLEDINENNEIIPTMIHDQVADYIVVRPHYFTTECHLTKDEALNELQSLVDLVEDSANCTKECQCEHAWNTLVRYQIFKTALAKSAGKTVKSWITKASIYYVVISYPELIVDHLTLPTR
ncbi:hypothetical protein F5B21DRAFT_193087 [Xylaria acuta]|nr:hypothetical protein F5B21DRAFT_193087 [Xylaria acuta]